MQEKTAPILLIADSGSTKTTWCLVKNGLPFFLSTAGINPATQETAAISAVLGNELMPQMALYLEGDEIIDQVHFYGAGCLPTLHQPMERLLRTHTGATDIYVASDLWAAVHALCGKEPGIACILGTGANSCLYDGKDITANTPPLGYILGDEGSGAYLGKSFLGNLLKGLFDNELYTSFMDEYQLDYTGIIQKVYREPNANRFMASLTPFLKKHREHPQIHTLLVSCFTMFFERNINPYRCHGLPVHFVGSIAHHFEAELKEAANSCHYQIGKILPQPIHDLVQYHMTNGKKTTSLDGF